MQDEQGKAFIECVASLPANTVAPSLTFDAECWIVFMNSQDNPLLNNSRMGLVDVIDAPNGIQTTLTHAIRCVAAKHGGFSKWPPSQFLDWGTVVVIGESVVACPRPLSEGTKERKRNHHKHYHTEGFPTSDVDFFVWGLTVEEEEVKISKICEAV
ncbi:hypothetical protein DL96DRAFT_1713335 [Flagelloscypha sp. PMI_526]|nr:hypothetical protein DL96DRAFT_1713335 [Flagelloscypha sp. PMI_526]